MKIATKLIAVIAAFLLLVGMLFACSAEQLGLKKPVNYKEYLTAVNPDFIISPNEAYQWHQFKDHGGPTYSGSSSWHSYMKFIEKKLNDYGVVDIVKNKLTYNRW